MKLYTALILSLLLYAGAATAQGRIGETFGRWIQGEYHICEYVTTTQVVCYAE